MIIVKNLRKKFDDKIIFDNFNLKINDGELIAITGKSGCGKTTLLNILGLIDSHYDGDVIYDGIKVRELKKTKKQIFVRNHINYLFQNYALIDDESVKKNIELALYYDKLSKIEKEKIIKDVLYDVGLNNYENKMVYTLSGGEQQRISLARAIVKKGNIILADEPTGNLDAENRDIVIENLIKLNEMGKTVIIVTHDMYVAQRCHRIIEL